MADSDNTLSVRKLLQWLSFTLLFFCQPVNRNQVFSTFKHVHELRHMNKLTGLCVTNDVKTEVL